MEEKQPYARSVQFCSFYNLFFTFCVIMYSLNMVLLLIFQVPCQINLIIFSVVCEWKKFAGENLVIHLDIFNSYKNVILLKERNYGKSDMCLNAFRRKGQEGPKIWDNLDWPFFIEAVGNSSWLSHKHNRHFLGTPTLACGLWVCYYRSHGSRGLASSFSECQCTVTDKTKPL